MVWFADPPVATTERLYVPAGVPFRLMLLPPPPLPPQEHMAIPVKTAHMSNNDVGPNLLSVRVNGKTSSPKKSTAHNHGVHCSLGVIVAEVRLVVVTLTFNVAAEVALTKRLAGVIEQLAPIGAPLQVKVVWPLNPAPPMVKTYAAGFPAGTVTELEPPDATARFRFPLTTCCKAADTLGAKYRLLP